MAIKLIKKQKYDGQGRPFGQINNPIQKLVVLLSTTGDLPNPSTNIEGLGEMEIAFAPGSLLLDSANSKKYIFDGEEWVEWEN